MKKIILISIALIMFAYLSAMCCAQNKYAFKEYKRLNKNISVDLSSIETAKDYKIGWFKIQNSFEKSYEIIKIKAYCDTKVLEIMQVKTYDKNHSLLNNEINNHSIGCDYNGLVNGETYFNTLCRE